MKSNKAKCQVLHLGRKNPTYQHESDGGNQLERNFAKNDLEVLVHNKLHVRMQYAFVTKKAAKH